MLSRLVVLRAACLLGFSVFLSSCNIALVVVKGGDVTSASGLYSCSAGSNCLVEVPDRSFAETFTAVPHEGYRFSHWLSADQGLCGGRTEPDCQIQVGILPDNPVVDDIIASDDIYYLIPVFVEEVPEPEPEPGLSPELQAKYDASCDRCHTTGAFGAPVIHDLNAWEPRLAKGLTTLLNSVKNGRGAMPPGGDCGNCSDDDYLALIEYMSGPAS